MASNERVTVRLGSAQLAKLDALAQTAGSRPNAVQRLLDGAEGAAPAKLDREHLLRLLEEKAKAGSAPAIRALLERKEQAEQLARLRSLTT